MPNTKLKVPTKSRTLGVAGVKSEKLKVEKPAVKKTATKEVTEPKTAKAGSLSVPVFSLEGKESGTLSLPEEIFGVEANKALISQALHIYLNNLKGHFSNTKTRGEVSASTHKIYRQKGTGGARHGSKKAPIFVGGGIALGPKFRKVVLDLPKKMKKVALTSALSTRAHEGVVFGVSGLDKASGKTSEMKNFLEKVAKKDVLFITDGKDEKVKRAVNNLPKTEITSADQINILDITRYHTLIFTKEAVAQLEARFNKKEEKKA